MSTLSTGTVKWFNQDKGYGFIEIGAGKKDVFVHARQVEESGIAELREGQRVQFEIKPGREGKSEAHKLKVV
jgi:CspA family cold shock protein